MAKNTKWKEEEDSVLYTYYPQGDYATILSLLPNRTKTAITVRATVLGIKREHFHWTKEEDDYLIKHRGVLPYSEIALNLNRDVSAVTRRVGYMKLPPDSRCRALSNRDYFYNENFFSTVTHNTAYWAGLIASDGNVYNNTLSISLHKKDADVLERFAEEIEFTGLIDHGQKDECCRIRLNGAYKLIEDLYSFYNITSCKSLTLQPPNLDDTLLLSFCVGIIDGDGCVYKLPGENRKSYFLYIATGSEDFGMGMQNKLKCLLPEQKRIRLRKARTCYRLEISGRKNYEFLAEHVIASSLKPMSRKWDGFLLEYGTNDYISH